MWEYKTVKLEIDGKIFGGKTFDRMAMEQEFNSLGKEGWELVAINDMTKIGHHIKYFLAVFKKQK